MPSHIAMPAIPTSNIAIRRSKRSASCMSFSGRPGLEPLNGDEFLMCWEPWRAHSNGQNTVPPLLCREKSPRSVHYLKTTRLGSADSHSWYGGRALRGCTRVRLHGFGWTTSITQDGFGRCDRECAGVVRFRPLWILRTGLVSPLLSCFGSVVILNCHVRRLRRRLPCQTIGCAAVRILGRYQGTTSGLGLVHYLDGIANLLGRLIADLCAGRSCCTIDTHGSTLPSRSIGRWRIHRLRDLPG